MLNKVYFDLDGVICDCVKSVSDFIWNTEGKRLPTPMSFKMVPPMGMTHKKLSEIIHYVIEDWENLLPIEESVNFIKGLDEVHFITARPPEFNRNVHKWFQKHVPDLNYVMYMSEGRNKGRMVQDLGGIALVDDRFATCEVVADHLKYVFLFSQPWNEGRELKGNVYRINALSEIPSILGE